MKQKIKDREGQIIRDREGDAIREGDFVSLDGNITADNSMGELPNGWAFDEDDIYEVLFDPHGHSKQMLNLTQSTTSSI